MNGGATYHEREWVKKVKFFVSEKRIICYIAGVVTVTLIIELLVLAFQ